MNLSKGRFYAIPSRHGQSQRGLEAPEAVSSRGQTHSPRLERDARSTVKLRRKGTSELTGTPRPPPRPATGRTHAFRQYKTPVTFSLAQTSCSLIFLNPLTLFRDDPLHALDHAGVLCRISAMALIPLPDISYRFQKLRNDTYTLTLIYTFPAAFPEYQPEQLIPLSDTPPLCRKPAVTLYASLDHTDDSDLYPS